MSMVFEGNYSCIYAGFACYNYKFSYFDFEP